MRLHTPEPEEAGQELSDDPRRYRAFETGMKPARLIIKPRNGPIRMPGYATLLDIIATPCGTGVTLIHTHLAVEVTGRNLMAVALAVGRHRAAVLTEYDPEAFNAPGEEEPVIEAVKMDVAAGA